MKKNTLLLICCVSWIFCSAQINLISNGDLEDWTSGTADNWQAQEGNVTQETTQVSNGISSALFVDGDTTPVLKALNFPVEAGKTYILRYDYKVKTATMFNQQVITMRYGGADFTPFSTNNRIPQDFEWSTREVEIEVTESEDWQFEISLGNFITDPFEVYIDNVSFTEVIAQPDRDALVAIYDALNGDNWTNTWDLNANYTTWFGVTTDENQKVTGLNLSNENLTGSLPTEIGDLDALNFLNLSFNSISGPLPESLYSLTNLHTLQLYSNDLSGELSEALGNLVGLNVLALDRNDFTGEIPDVFENLTLLQTLHLGNNTFEGSIPLTLENMNIFTSISLNNNNLTGEIPVGFANLDLRNLNLSYNDLTGSIPESFDELVHLETLKLEYNSLSGELPSFVNSLSLRVVNFQDNEFTGPYPSDLLEIPEMVIINLNNNDFDPYLLTENSIALLEGLIEFSSRDTNLIGVLPINLDTNPLLQKMDLSYNNLSGEVPAYDTTSFNQLQIHQNNFVFDDLEPSFDFYQNGIFTYIYSGQQFIEEEASIVIEEGEAITLEITATTSENNTYQWRKNGADIAGATNQNYTIEAAQLEDLGVYDCILNNSVISDLSLQRNAIELTVTLSNEDFKKEVGIYPVPAHNLLNIISSSQDFFDTQIINVLGQEVFASKANVASETIDVSSFENGVYFITLIEGTRSFTKKIVVAHK